MDENENEREGVTGNLYREAAVTGTRHHRGFWVLQQF